MTADRGERLVVLAFATFHATSFVLIGVLIAYRGGGLGQTLQGLNTVVGLGLFIALWVTTYIATRNALQGIDVSSGARIDGDALIRGAFRWGGLNGVMFLLVLASGLLVANMRIQAENVMQTVLFAFAALVPASVVAFLIGALVGVLFAGVDLILLGVAARILRSTLGGPERAEA